MTWRRIRGISALAVLLLEGVAIEILKDGLLSTGWPRVAAALIALVLLAAIAVDHRRWIARQLWALAGRRTDGLVGPKPPAIRAYADQAEERLAELGTQAGGMASVEWFRANERELIGQVTEERPVEQLTADAVDDIARIADALDRWYVMQRRGPALVLLGRHLEQLADRVDRYDLQELALVRVAAGHRLANQPREAWEALGHSDGIAARGTTSAAVKTRRQVEWALLHLDRAGADLPADETEDALHNAHDRLDDASASIPRADVEAEIALRIDMGVVALYRGDPIRARQRLRAAASRADQARDTSAHAHAIELIGVAAWLEGKAAEAVEWWRQAARMYVEVDEVPGRARCLAHLGTLGMADPTAAAALGGRAAARRHLETSRALLGGVPAHPVEERVREAPPAGPLRRAVEPLLGWLRGRPRRPRGPRP